MTTETGEANLDGLRDTQMGPAELFGWVLATVGVLDYFGVGVSDDRFLGLVALPPGLNLLHVTTGLLGLVLSRYAGGGALFNKVGGVIYAVASLVGLLRAGNGTGSVATTVFHLLLAVVVGAVGFGVGETRPR